MSDIKAAAILGVGAVTACGRGLWDISLRLGEAAGAESVLRVDDKLLATPEVGGRMRRADRFVKMAVAAALDAWKEAGGCAGVEREKVGLIVASGLGPHGRGFRFLDGILDCGDNAALPTDFSHSVHGAASAYIAEVLQLRGPAMAVSDFANAFGQAVLLGQMWLAQGRCERVIVGAVEEVGEVMLHCVKEMAGVGVVAGEGAVFLVLGRQEGRGIEIDARGGEGEMVVEEGMFAPWYGRSASGAAFDALGGLIMLWIGSVDSVAIVVPSSGGEERLVLRRVGR